VLGRPIEMFMATAKEDSEMAQDEGSRIPRDHVNRVRDRSIRPLHEARPAIEWLAPGAEGDCDHVALEMHFNCDLPPDTDSGPVEHDLQQLAARVAVAFGGTFCRPEVQLLTPDDPDSVIERAHLCVKLDVLHFDVIGMRGVYERLMDQLSRTGAFVEEQKPARLRRLELTLVHADVLQGRGSWRQWEGW
jgi:hypothetical protein